MFNQKTAFEVKTQGVVLGGARIGEQPKGDLKRLDIAAFELMPAPKKSEKIVQLDNLRHVLNERGLFVMFNKKLMHADTAEFLKETGSADLSMFRGTAGVPNPCHIWSIPTGIIVTSIYADSNGKPAANLYWARLAEYHNMVGKTRDTSLPIFIDVQSGVQNKVIAILGDRIYTHKIPLLFSPRLLQGKDLHMSSMADTWLLCEKFDNEVAPKYYLDSKTGMPEPLGNKAQIK